MATLAAHDPGHGTPLVLDENKPFWLQQALYRSYSSRVWARALA